jgi:TatD DNase family protein
MNASLVDFHCHLDLFPDLDRAIGDAESAGVYTLTVTTTPKAWPRNLELTKGKRFVRAALGLHPQLVAERSAEISLWERYLPQARYVGEVGIDAGPQYYRSLELQQSVFERVLAACATAGDKILTVHSVRSVGLVLDLIEKHLAPERGQVVLHWFGGTKAEARRAVDLGCYFSVNEQMARNEKGRDLISSFPIERLLTETDAPFTELDGRPTRPPDAAAVVAAIASLRGTTVADIAVAVHSNLRAVLSRVPGD